MAKKIVFWILTMFFCFMPSLSWAVAKLNPPNLVEVRIDDKFIDKSKVSVHEDQPLDLLGTAKPLSSVWLYIDSTENAKVAKVNVDNKGNWQYRLNIELSRGNHEIFAETHVGNQISKNIKFLDFTVTMSTTQEMKYVFWSILALVVVAAILIVGYARRIKFLRGKK